jgi:hypothetical protein
MRDFRKNNLRLTAVILTTLVLTACSTYPKTFSNESPLENFGTYETYRFGAHLGTDEQSGVRSLLSQYLIAEITAQMNARGYQHNDDQADMVFFFDLTTQEKIRGTPSTTVGVGYGYGRYPGYGYYGGYGGGTHITQYTEGSLSVVIVDEKAGSVVWEGISVSRITDAIRDNLAEAVKSAVSDMYTRFSHYAPGTERPALADSGD